MNRKVYYKLCVFLIILFSCNNSEGTPVPNVSVELSKGAQNLQNGLYSDAITSFQRVLLFSKNNELRAKAYAGIAFVNFRRSIDEWSVSLKNFEESLKESPNNVDALSGRSLLLYSKEKDYMKVIEDAERVLQKNPQFKMSLDERIDKNDMLLIISLSYIYIDKPAEALSAIKKISGQENFSVDTTTSEGKQKLADRIDALLELYRQ